MKVVSLPALRRLCFVMLALPGQAPGVFADGRPAGNAERLTRDHRNRRRRRPGRRTIPRPFSPLHQRMGCRRQGTTHRDNTLHRWAVHLQNDFRARLEWCVASVKKANHPPGSESAR
jgi:hypothetical protein